MTNERNYQQAVAPYVATLRGLFAPRVSGGGAGGVRGEESLPPEEVAARSQVLVDTLQQVGTLTAGYLQGGNRSQQEAAELKLLAQAGAQFDLARNLLELAGSESRDAAGQVTRGGQGAQLQQSLEQLIAVLDTPLEMNIPAVSDRGATERPTDFALAKKDLKEEVANTLRLICRDAGTVGRQAAQTLLLMDPATLSQGVALISKDAAGALDKVVSGVSQLAKQLISSAVAIILQAYDWVLALLGKDIEDKARQQAANWIDELKKDQKDPNDPGLMGTVVGFLYAPDTINSDVAGWLQTTKADPALLNKTADTVQGLAARYESKTDGVKNILRLIGLTKNVPIPVIKTPQIQAVIAAVVLGLLAYTLYSGYDHVDSGQITFMNRFGVSIPDRVDGVRETTQKALKA